MKKLSKIMLAALLSFMTVGIAAGCGNFRMNEIGADKYYVQITKDGDKRFEGKHDGKDVYFYHYDGVKAYNDKGEEIKVKFIADKNLRKKAYLSIKVRDPKSDQENDILSYEEVQPNDLPDKVKEKLNVK